MSTGVAMQGLLLPGCSAVVQPPTSLSVSHRLQLEDRGERQDESHGPVTGRLLFICLLRLVLNKAILGIVLTFLGSK